MTDGKGLVDKFHRENGGGSCEGCGFFDTVWLSGRVNRRKGQGKPCVGALSYCFGDDAEGELGGEGRELRVGYHGSCML